MSALKKAHAIIVRDALFVKLRAFGIAKGAKDLIAEGKVIDAGLAAASAVQTMAAFAYKTLGKAAPPVLIANLLNDGRHIRKELKEGEPLAKVLKTVALAEAGVQKTAWSLDSDFCRNDTKRLLQEARKEIRKSATPPCFPPFPTLLR